MCLSSALNRSSEISCFKRSDAIEIRDGIMVIFYSGLPHLCLLIVIGSKTLVRPILNHTHVIGYEVTGVDPTGSLGNSL